MWHVTRRSIAVHRRRLLATCSAVLLGVAFLTGTLALGDTLRRGFAGQFREANAGIDAVVRSSVVLGHDDVAQRAAVDRSLVDAIAAVDGAAAAAPRIEGPGRVVGSDGRPIGGLGRPTVAGNWVDDSRLNPYDLAEGRAPAAPGEVVIDRRTAREGALAVGDTTRVLTPDPVDVVIVGVATFGTADSQGATTYAAFNTDVAGQVLMRDPGTVSSIAVAAAQGVSQTELVGRIDAVLPDGVESLTGAEFIAGMERKQSLEDALGFVETALPVFSGIALVVAAFSIANTFGILVAQRTRESALLRALGATRGQVLRSAVGEALVVGAVASVVGVVAGMGLTMGLLALLEAQGRPLPPSTITMSPTTVVLSLAVGGSVTVLASAVPAVRASRVTPLAALRDVAVDTSARSRMRAFCGAAATGLGVVLVVAGAVGEAVVVAGIGAAATVVGVLVLGPVVAVPAVAVLGAPQAAWLGISGALARRNAMRDPRRTAGTAAPLMIGVALVSLFTVVAASVTRSIGDQVDAQLAADLMIVGEGVGGLSADLEPAVAAVPEVAAALGIGGGPVRVDGEQAFATAVDPVAFASMIEVSMRDGSLRDLGPDGVAVSATYADGHGVALGDPVTIDYPDEARRRHTVAAVYPDDGAFVGGEIMLHRDALAPHTNRPVAANMVIALEDGVSLADGGAAVQRVVDRFSAPEVLTGEEFTQLIAGEIGQLLTVVHALLAMSILIALMGIANTVSLSIHERTRELGLLRAVGQTRRQARTMVHSEAWTVALFGTLGGVGLGLFLAWGIVRGLAAEGYGTFTVPPEPVAIVVTSGALVGVVAAIRPARRASRLDVLDAIAVE